MRFTRFIALGDSMTEGMSDEVVKGKYRGWADRVADVLVKDDPNFTYVNLAIRGKLLKQVVEDQIPSALKYIEGKQPLFHFMLVLMMCLDQITSQRFLSPSMKKG